MTDMQIKRLSEVAVKLHRIYGVPRDWLFCAAQLHLAHVALWGQPHIAQACRQSIQRLNKGMKSAWPHPKIPTKRCFYVCNARFTPFSAYFDLSYPLDLALTASPNPPRSTCGVSVLDDFLESQFNQNTVFWEWKIDILLLIATKEEENDSEMWRVWWRKR